MIVWFCRRMSSSSSDIRLNYFINKRPERRDKRKASSQQLNAHCENVCVCLIFFGMFVVVEIFLLFGFEWMGRVLVSRKLAIRKTSYSCQSEVKLIYFNLNFNFIEWNQNVVHFLESNFHRFNFRPDTNEWNFENKLVFNNICSMWFWEKEKCILCKIQKKTSIQLTWDWKKSIYQIFVVVIIHSQTKRLFDV